MTLHGEAGSFDQSAIKKGIAEMKRVLLAFDLDAIYNMDETGLFYRLLPRKLYVFKDDKSTVRGTKEMKAKDRIM